MAGKKKSMAQQAVSLVAPVMPAPVASVASTRFGSWLFVLLVPFLLATGVLTISWNNGMPSVNFDRARAWIVGREVEQRFEQEAVRAVQQYGGQPAAAAESQSGWGQPQSATPQPQWQPQTSQQPQAGQWQPQTTALQPQTSYQPSYQPAYQQAYQPQTQPQTQYPAARYPAQPAPQYQPYPQVQSYQPYQPQQAAQPYGAPAYR